MMQLARMSGIICQAACAALEECASAYAAMGSPNRISETAQLQRARRCSPAVHLAIHMCLH